MNSTFEDGIKLVPHKKKLRKGWNEFFSKHHDQVDVDLEFLESDIKEWFNALEQIDGGKIFWENKLSK